MRKLKLLVFATVCWVAPLAAQQAPLVQSAPGCPFAHAQTGPKVDDNKPAISAGVPAEGSLFDVSLRRRSLPRLPQPPRIGRSADDYCRYRKAR